MKQNNPGKLYSQEELMNIKVGNIKLFKLEKTGKIVINTTGQFGKCRDEKVRAEK